VLHAEDTDWQPLSVGEQRVFDLATNDAQASALVRAWRRAIVEHPRAYLAHRLHLWLKVLGWTDRRPRDCSRLIRIPSLGRDALVYRACGMSRLLLFRRIIFPIAVRQALPGYGSELILMVKATSLASIITMMEVTGIAHKLISQTFRAVEIFICAGAIYLILNFLVTRAIQGLEWWLSPHLRQPPEVLPRAEAAHV